MNYSESDLNDRVRAWLGTGTMLVASVFAVLIMCDRMEVDFVPLPATWYASRQMHLVVCGTLFLCAAMLLRSPVPRSSGHDGQPLFRKCRLLTRQHCELCDAAMATLMQYQDALPPIEVVDIDRDPQLIRQFGESVPVVEIDGRVRFRGAVHPALLSRLIDAAELRMQNREQNREQPETKASELFANRMQRLE